MAFEFSPSDDSVQAFLGHCHRRRYPAKSAIIRQGDPAGDLFYIVSGSVTVMLEGDTNVRCPPSGGLAGASRDVWPAVSGGNV